MKQRKLLIILMLVTFMLAPIIGAAPYLSIQDAYADTAPFIGSGTASSPYLIASAEDMRMLSSLCLGSESERYLSAHYKLTANIDMGGICSTDADREIWSGESFYPIAAFEGVKYVSGQSSGGFSGVFNGNGKVISNLYIDERLNYVGLFGVIDGGTVKNLVIDDGYVSGKQFVGGIAGSVFGSGVITDCINGTLARAEGSHCGGITGYVYGSSTESASVIRCINMGGASSEKYVGGIVGSNDGKISECFNIGGVSGTSVRGAIAGSNGTENNPNAVLIRTYYNKDNLILGNEKFAPTEACGTSKTQCEDNKLTASKMVTLYGETSPLGMELTTSYWTFKKPTSSSDTYHYYPIPKTLSGSYSIGVEVLPGIFTVTFDLNGADGEAPEAQQIREGEYATAPKNPVRSGYEFVRWAKDAKEGTEAFDFTNTKITDDITLYAIWVFKDPKVTLSVTVTNGRTATTAVYGDIVTITVNVEHGASNITYEWYKQGAAGKVVSRSKTLTLRNVLESGIYYCKVKVYDSENYKYKLSDDVDVKISKAIDPNYEVPTISPVTYYEGLTLGDLELPDGYSWLKPSTKLSATGSDGAMFSFRYVPSDKDNYETITRDKIKVVVYKAKYDTKVHASIEAVYKYDLKLDDIKLDCYFYWLNPSTLVYAGEEQVFAAYYNADPDNYNDYYLTIIVSVDKAQPTVKLDKSGVTLYENTDLDMVTIPTLDGSTPGECKFVLGQKLVVGVESTYKWEFTPEDTDNYYVSYGEIKLFVYGVRLERIEVSKKPIKMSYTAFDEVNTEGMEIIKVFNSGDTEIVHESGYSISYIGNKTGQNYFLCNSLQENISHRSIRITLNDNRNFYCDVDGFVVEKARYDLDEVAHPDITLTYSPELTFFSISSQLEKGYTLVSSVDKLNAGYGQLFDITYNGDSYNYYDAELKVTVNIDKADYGDAVKKKADKAHSVIIVTYIKEMTLSDIPLKECFYWVEEMLLVNAGDCQSFRAYYNTDVQNYNSYELDIIVTIYRAKFELGEYSFNGQEFSYDAKEHSIFVDFENGIPEGVKINYSGNGVSRAGKYTVTASFELLEPQNYEPLKSLQAEMIILKRDITVDFNSNFDGSFIVGEEIKVGADVFGLLDGDSVVVKLKLMDSFGKLLAEGDNCISGIFEPGYYKIVAEIYDDNYKFKSQTEMTFTVKTASVESDAIKGELPQVVVSSVNGFDPDAYLKFQVNPITNAKELNEMIFRQIGDYEIKQMYNIELLNNVTYEKIEINGTVQIKIRIPDEFLDEDIELNIIYVGENGVLELKNAEKIDNYLVFNTDHLSNYAIVGSIEKGSNPDIGPNNPVTPTPSQVESGSALWLLLVIAGIFVTVTVVAYVKIRK